MRYTLEVGELIDELQELIPYGVKMKFLDKIVRYDFSPDTGGMYLDSWRGVYSELTLSPNTGGKDITLGELLESLESSIKGKVFHGYKGGEYRMNIDTAVWADPSGSYIGRMIIGVKDTAEYIILKTEIQDD